MKKPLTIKQHLLDNLRYFSVTDHSFIARCLNTYFHGTYGNNATTDDAMLKDFISQYDDNPRLMVRTIRNEETIDLLKLVKRQFKRDQKRRKSELLKSNLK